MPYFQIYAIGFVITFLAQRLYNYYLYTYCSNTKILSKKYISNSDIVLNSIVWFYYITSVLVILLIGKDKKEVMKIAKKKEKLINEKIRISDILVKEYSTLKDSELTELTDSIIKIDSKLEKFK